MQKKKKIRPPSRSLLAFKCHLSFRFESASVFTLSKATTKIFKVNDLNRMSSQKCCCQVLNGILCILLIVRQHLFDRANNAIDLFNMLWRKKKNIITSQQLKQNSKLSNNNENAYLHGLREIDECLRKMLYTCYEEKGVGHRK